MAFERHDLVKETSTITGTGPLTLAGAVSGFKTFTSAFTSGATLTYAIAASNGQYEMGTGTFTAPSTLARTTLIESSTGSFLDLPAGTHSVFCALSATELALGALGAASLAQAGLIPVTQAGHGFTLIGTPVYTADGSTWAAAAADDAATIHTGVIASIDGDDLVIQQSGVLSGITFATLTPGEFYFLGDDGSLALTEGTISAPVLQALTSSSALILPYRASGEAEIQAANITDATSTGRALLTSATVSAAQQAVDLEPGVDVSAFGHKHGLAQIFRVVGTNAMRATTAGTWAYIADDIVGSATLDSDYCSWDGSTGTLTITVSGKYYISTATRLSSITAATTSINLSRIEAGGDIINGLEISGTGGSFPLPAAGFVLFQALTLTAGQTIRVAARQTVGAANIGGFSGQLNIFVFRGEGS